MKYGMENSNYRHGGYCNEYDIDHIKIGLAKDLLRRIMTTPCDAGGNVPFTGAEVQWSFRVARERPDWARDTLAAVGLNDAYYEAKGGGA